MCHCDNSTSGQDNRCQCGELRMERFIQPCLLLLLYEKPSHGYELLDRLKEFGFDYSLPDTGAIYRNLRNMESDGLVSSEWDVDSPGPAKRSYCLTPSGVTAIHSWASHAKTRLDTIGRFLKRYEQSFPAEKSDGGV